MRRRSCSTSSCRSSLESRSPNSPARARATVSCAWRPVSTRRIAIGYWASVDCDFQTYRAGAVEPTPVAELSASAIPYLFPSRYCQSDRLSRLAWDLFGKIENPHAEGGGHQRLDPRQRRVPARLDQLDDLGLRHSDAADRRVPRLFAPGHRSVPGAEHPIALLRPATPMSSIRPTSMPVSNVSSAAAGRSSTPRGSPISTGWSASAPAATPPTPRSPASSAASGPRRWRSAASSERVRNSSRSIASS